MPTELCIFSLALALSYANDINDFTDPNNLKDCFLHIGLKSDSCGKIRIYFHHHGALRPSCGLFMEEEARNTEHLPCSCKLQYNWT